MQDLFEALVVQEQAGEFMVSLQHRSRHELDGEVVIAVRYSSLNYKDALSASGNRGVTKSYPHTPGIDAAGVVVSSRSALFAPGDEVIVTSYDLGMNTPGGYSQYISVPADWVVHLPAGLSLREAMILGTAGFTAALSLDALCRYCRPEDGLVAVSGASGGVGSVAVALLAAAGYDVLALSGKESEQDFLLSLGAKAVVSRSEFATKSKRPLLKAYLAGAIDTVGGDILSNLLKLTQPRGAVTCCGNAASADMDITVYPFILRGISLLGIDSQNCPMSYRQELWQRLASEWKSEKLLSLSREIKLSEVPEALQQMLAGNSRGRTIVAVS